MTELSPSVQKIVDFVVQEVKPEKIVLFGSHARGTAETDSDVDLLVISNRDSHLPRRFRQAKLQEKFFGRDYPPVDALIYSPAEVNQRRAMGDFFIQEILEQGRILYEQ